MPKLCFYCLISMLLFSLGGCVPQKKMRTIYLPAPLTGRLHGKGTLFRNSLSLFVDISKEESWTLETVDSSSEPYRAGEALKRVWRQHQNGDVVFGLAATDLMEHLSLKDSHFADAVNSTEFLWDTVTAGWTIPEKFRVVKTFFSSGDYFEGVFEEGLANEKRPSKVHLWVEPEVGYFQEISKDVFTRLRALKVKNVEKVVMPPSTDTKKLRAAWNQMHVRPDDWVIFLTSRPQEFIGLFSDPIFAKVPKFFTYGQSIASVQNPELSFWKNSFFPLFWHEAFEFQNEYKISNCEYVEQFLRRFGHLPDFHAAFIFASMEVASQLGRTNPFDNKEITKFQFNTITGIVRWDSMGRRTGLRPLLIYVDRRGITQVHGYDRIKNGCWKSSIVQIHEFLRKTATLP